MKYFNKPTALLIAFISTLISSADAITANIYHGPNLCQPNFEDSFFFKKAPISGSVTLILGDRSIVLLETIRIGKNITPTILKKEEDRLEFFSPQNKSDSNYYTLIVPFLTKCQLRLPDGTEVVMQGGSSLRFPRVFSKSERKVELNGSAYFHIARRDRRPFIIRTNTLIAKASNSRIAVQDFPDGYNPNVVVDSGLAEVITGSDSTNVLAGQELISRNGQLSCTYINIKEELFWKNEYLIFDGLEIKPALTKVANAYRMHIIFEDNVKAGPFGSGSIPIDIPLDRLLKDLELPDLHFEIRMQDSTILVKG